MTSREWLIAHEIFPDKDLIKALDEYRQEAIKDYERKRWEESYRDFEK